MLNVEYNYFKKIFPFIVSSKFNLKKFSEQPSIKIIEFSLSLSGNFPEILFWVLFSLNNKKPCTSYCFKRKYISGKSVSTKVFLKISKKFGSKHFIILNLFKVYHKMILLAQDINIMKSYPLKNVRRWRTFSFNTITFEEKYSSLMNVAPNSWDSFNLQINVLPKFSNGFHFRFLLQNLQLPIF